MSDEEEGYYYTDADGRLQHTDFRLDEDGPSIPPPRNPMYALSSRAMSHSMFSWPEGGRPFPQPKKIKMEPRSPSPRDSVFFFGRKTPPKRIKKEPKSPSSSGSLFSLGDEPRTTGRRRKRADLPPPRERLPRAAKDSIPPNHYSDTIRRNYKDPSRRTATARKTARLVDSIKAEVIENQLKELRKTVNVAAAKRASSRRRVVVQPDSSDSSDDSVPVKSANRKGRQDRKRPRRY